MSSHCCLRVGVTDVQKSNQDPLLSNTGSTLGEPPSGVGRTSASTAPGGMDEVDHHGNTPLLLALQLGRLECANVSLRTMSGEGTGAKMGFDRRS